ncbi:MAG: hypothetical protein H6711_09470 [Myxococcales bacterium]|nr:hypothetical protein [Myxococcales bacterium]
MRRNGPDIGLRWIPTATLKKLLRHVHHQEIECPLAPIPLAALGLQEQAERLLGALRGLDAAGVRAVLVAVLAERIDEG